MNPNPTTAFVSGTEERPPLYFTLQEGGAWERYDGRPYDQCAAIAFEHNGSLIVLDFVVWRLIGQGKSLAHPVRISLLPAQGLPD